MTRNVVTGAVDARVALLISVGDVPLIVDLVVVEKLFTVLDVLLAMGLAVAVELEVVEYVLFSKYLVVEVDFPSPARI